MKELREVIRGYREAREQGEMCALATVVRVRGSAYRRPGARMLVTATGGTVGGVSGGCLEADVVRRARFAVHQGESRLVTYDTTDEDDLRYGVGTGCRGVVEILVEPLPAGACYLDALEEWLSRRTAGVVATVLSAGGGLRPGDRLTLDEDGDPGGELAEHRLAGPIATDARGLLHCEERWGWRTLDVDGATVELFLERIEPALPLVLFGGGRDAVPLARLAAELGWHVTVTDGRPGYATRSRFPGADALLTATPAEALSRLSIDRRTVAVAMSHHYALDLEALRVLLPSPARYVGLLGPLARAECLLADLRDSGHFPAPEQLRRLHAPVGLDLGAETPEEIALSILAEIRGSLSQRSAAPLRERTIPIHRATAGPIRSDDPIEPPLDAIPHHRPERTPTRNPPIITRGLVGPKKLTASTP